MSYPSLYEFYEYASLLGINPVELNPPSEHCKPVLEMGLTPDVCADFREIRRWVMCRAWELLDTKQAFTFREAIRRAWAEAHEGCARAGVTGEIRRIIEVPEDVREAYMKCVLEAPPECKYVDKQGNVKCRIECFIEYYKKYVR